MQALLGTYAPTILTVREATRTESLSGVGRSYYQLLAVHEGAHRLKVLNNWYELRDREVALIPPTLDYRCECAEEARSARIHFIIQSCPLVFTTERQKAVKMVEPLKPQPQPEEMWGCTLPVVQPPEVGDIVFDLVDFITSTCWHGWFERLRGNQRLAYVLECIVGAQLDSRRDLPKDAPVLQRVHNVVHAQLKALRTAKDIADRLGMSVSSLEKIYKAQTGKTPTSYLRHYRMMETERLLSSCNDSLNAIASIVGYRDGKGLYRAWMRKHAIPPLEWRRQFTAA